MLQRTHSAPRNMATDLVVGEFLTFSMRVGGADLVFGLQAKTAAKLGLINNSGVSVDSVRIVLTIEPKQGQRARVRVQAPDSVRITKPDKAAA